MRSADIRFAPKELREQWNASREVSAIEVLKSEIDTAPKEKPSGWAGWMQSLEEPQRIMAERQNISDACKEALLGHIKSGALRSFAFGAPRTVNACPVELAPRVWHGRLKWEGSTIVHESITYVEVRLISRRHSSTLLGAQIEDAIPSGPRPTIGRPSYKPDIERAFNALLEAGKIDLDASTKSQCQTIRDWLVHFVPNGGFGPDKPKYDAIRRHLKPLVEQAKSTG